MLLSVTNRHNRTLPRHSNVEEKICKLSKGKESPCAIFFFGGG